MKKRYWLIPAAVLLALALIFGPGLYTRYRAVKLAQDWLGGEAGTADVMLTEPEVSGRLAWLDTEEGRLWRLESGPLTVFYSGGVIYLENGKGYDFSGAVPEMPEDLWRLLPAIEVEKEGSRFFVTLRELSLTMTEGEKALSAAAFSAPGLRGSLTVRQEPAMEPPGAVMQAMASGAVQGGRDLTRDLLALMRAWVELESREPLGLELTLRADLGDLELSRDMTLLRSAGPDFPVWGLKTGGGTVYFGGGRVCIGSGRILADSEVALHPQALLGLVYELCLNGELECGAGEYRVALEETGMKALLSALLPEAGELPLESGSLTIRLEDDAIASVSLSCRGTLDLLVTKLDTTLRADLIPQKTPQFPIPEAVIAALTEQ